MFRSMPKGSRRQGAAAIAVAVVGFAGLAGAMAFAISRGTEPAAAIAESNTSLTAAYRAEEALLGPEHARHHLALARAEGSPRGSDGGSTARRGMRPSRTGGPARLVGRWTTRPFTLPNSAINLTLLPTGKVLSWGRPFVDPDTGIRPNAGVASIWDPRLGTGSRAMRRVTPPAVDHDGDPGTPDIPAPLVCSGNTHLPNGEVFAAGGNLIEPPDPPYIHSAGWSGAVTFDPWSETWTLQPEMERGRWYPSQVLLGDGRTLVLGGYDETPPGEVDNPQAEIFEHPGGRSMPGKLERLPSADRIVPIYPHLFTLPGGDVLMAGPDADAVDVLNVGPPGDLQPGDWLWESDVPGGDPPAAPVLTRKGGNVVLVPRGPRGSSSVMRIGGYDPDRRTHGDALATSTTETLDAEEPGATWRPRRPLRQPRSHANSVLLPDGNLATIGGGGGEIDHVLYKAPADGRLRRMELYNRNSGRWRLGPAQREDRAYHSTALLLPDGRVLSAGDDFNPRTSDEVTGYSTSDTAEIYSPPYLFRGPRPRIRKAPPSARYGDDFGVSIRARGPKYRRMRIARAVLMAPSAVTHGVDMTQRQIPLRIRGHFKRRGINVVAPSDPGVAPPGFYMLYLLNIRGVPSIARWVKLDPSAPDRPSLRRLRRR